MSVSPALGSPHSTEPQADAAPVRAEAAQTFPPSGTGSTGEIDSPEGSASVDSDSQDVVKVLMEPPGEIVVYQFVDQHGTLVLQVPPQQLLNLALQISQDLAKEAASKAQAVEGGTDHGR